MFFQDEFLERSQAGAGGFHQHKDFAAGFDFFLPPVMGFQPGNEVGAGDEARFESGAREVTGGFQVGCGYEDEVEPGGGLHGARVILCSSAGKSFGEPQPIAYADTDAHGRKKLPRKERLFALFKGAGVRQLSGRIPGGLGAGGTESLLCAY